MVNKFHLRLLTMLALTTLSVGGFTSVWANNSTVVGDGAAADAEQSVAVGPSAHTSSNNSVAVGASAKTENHDSVAIGANSDAKTYCSIAIGSGAVASGWGNTAFGASSIAVGADAMATGIGSNAYGKSANASGDFSVVLGATSRATKNRAIAIGFNTSAMGAYTVAVGSGSYAGNNSATAIGTFSHAYQENDVVVGSSASAGGTDAGKNANTAMGTSSSATGGESAAYGYSAHATGNVATAIGSRAEANYDHATALGNAAKASADDSVAIGYHSQATLANGIALGNNSITDAASTTNTTQVSITNNNVTKLYDLGTTGQTSSGVFSVGNQSQGIYRQIKNVANGEVSPTSTDAVNGEQLYGVAKDAMTAVSVTANAALYDNTTKNTITLQGTNGSTTIDKVAPGTLAADSLQAVNGSQLYATNTNVTDLQNKLNQINPNNRSNVQYDNADTKDRITLQGTAGTTIIDKVTPGTLAETSLQAVNGGQLYKTNTIVDGHTTQLANHTKQLSNHTTELADHTTELASHTTELSAHTTELAYLSSIVSPVSKTKVNSALQNKSTYKMGKQSVSFGYNAMAPTDNSAAIGSDSLTTAVHTGTDAQQITFNGKTQTYAGQASVANGSISFGAQYHERQLQNVAAGDISSTSTDAVNGSQLYATNTNVTDLLNKLNQISPNDTSSVHYDDASTKDRITLKGTSGSTIIDKVTAGALAADSLQAVNGSQLYATNTDVTDLQNKLNQINTNDGTIVHYDNASTKDRITLQGTGGSTIIDRVTAGALAADSLQAVNGSQLYATNTNVTDLQNKLNQINPNDTSSVHYDNATTKDRITLKGTNGTTIIDKVTAGTLAKTSLQAVNGGQLYQTNTTVDSHTTELADHATELADHTTELASHTLQLTDDATELASHATELQRLAKIIGVSTSNNTKTKAVLQDKSTNPIGKASLTFGYDTMAATDNSVAIGSDSLTTAVHTGTGAGQVTFNGKTQTYAGPAAVANGSISFGSPGKERQLQYVAAGDISGTSTDAVNGSQLYATNANLSALQTSLSNVTGLAPTFNSVTLGNGASQIIMNGSGISIGGHTYITDNGINANNQKITNVQNGTVSASSTDAINGSQLYSYLQSQGNTATSANAVTTRMKRSAALLSMGSEAVDAADSSSNSNAVALAANSSSQSAAANSTIDISTLKDQLGGVYYDDTTKKDTVTLTGSNGTKITNLQSGSITASSTDAVNGGQLYAVQEKVTAAEDAIGTLNTGMNKLTSDMNNLSTRVDKVGAGAAALASLHPLDYDPDNKFDVAAGLGHYSGETAGAVGAFYRPNEDTIISMGAEIGNGENMWNAGLTFKVGSGNGSKAITSRTVMAKKIVGLEAEVQELKEQAKTQDLKQQTEIQELKQQIEILMQKNK